ncbi:gliding motility-associated C-terminal domain-containing protein [uncultured Planktosalinus sp.]|uniref:T9SS type B sorting domain-containing protein n=1 Tax=uncultured Planktosalinus sp. TaxID=1810935 RepID=UPI0030D6FABD
MKNNLLPLYFLIVLLFSLSQVGAQEVNLYEQFNGRYDFTAIGNTLNTVENGLGAPCIILTASSATLNLEPTQNIVAAYLYWAGSGDGDFEVSLNNEPITAERTFSNELDPERIFFAAFANVTQQLQNTGNGVYTLSELDLTEVITPYCPSGTNFGGWSVIIIYEDAQLNLNQLNVYDGLESVSSLNPELSIVLENLNVIDNEGAKIGFLAWEGDESIAVNETLQINNSIISNPPLNPANNAFNGTNTYTNSSELWNMDMDVYGIQNNIQVGDTQATISLSSGQDLVMINNIVTLLNSQLPDATISIDEFTAGEECGNREVNLNYTVFNTNSTDVLPANTPIAFYANTSLVASSTTQASIPIDGSESSEITFSIPPSIPQEFTLTLAVDDTGNGMGVVNEIDENNNTDAVQLSLLVFPEIPGLTNQEICDAVGPELFDLTISTQQVNPEFQLTFHQTTTDAENNENPIATPESYEIQGPEETIFIRVDNGDCFSIGSFVIQVISCPLPDATIYITDDLNACRQRLLQLKYIVANTLGTAPLPAETPIAFYINEQLYATDLTPIQIPEGGQIHMTTSLELSDNVPDVFELLLRVDDTGDNSGIVEELDETNNTFSTTVQFSVIDDLPILPGLDQCNEGFGLASFDLTEVQELIPLSAGDEVRYFTSYEEALTLQNPVLFPGQYQSTSNPQTIYVRLDTELCFTIGEFRLSITDCPPWIPEGFSPNNDGINDVFEISGLLNIYPLHELLIYTRKGNLIFKGNNQTGFWDGYANHGLLYEGAVPSGVYFYVLNLNHPDYKVFTGWVYLNK